MKIKSIYISQGLFCTEHHFEPGFNLIYSEKKQHRKDDFDALYFIWYGLCCSGNEEVFY